MTKERIHPCSFCHCLGKTKKVVIEYDQCDKCDVSEYILNNKSEVVIVTAKPQILPDPPRRMEMPPGMDPSVFTPPADLKL